MPRSKLRLAAGVTCAALAASAAVLTAPMAAQAAPAVSLGHYTCQWSISLGAIGRTGQPSWNVIVPVTCNGVMDVIAISVWGVNPSGHVNWTAAEPPCYATATCELGRPGDIAVRANGFDQKVVACIAIRVRAASASDCKTKDVV